MQFDADVAGRFRWTEVYFGDSRKALAATVDGGADIVMLGEEIGGAGSLRTKRCGRGTGQRQ